jgi:hypothetical protein
MKISRRNFLAVAGAAAAADGTPAAGTPFQIFSRGCRCSDRLRRFLRFLYQHCFFRSCQLCRRFRRSRRR